MRVCLYIFVLWIFDFGSCGQLRSKSTIKYLTEPTNDITIRLMVHLDEVLTRKLVKQHKITTRKKLKMLTNRVLDDAKKYFKHPSLNQTVNFKLLDTRFVRNGRAFAIDANAAKYLKNYCDWQTKKKTTQNKLYYSVLMTGMDLFHIHNGKQIRTNSGRSYTRGACSVHKSCALVEWDPKIIGFLFAHEIGHSLGMGHDGTSIYCKEQTNIMAMRYDPWHHPKSWSTCSLNSLKQFMRSRQSWCVRNDRNPSITFKYSRL